MSPARGLARLARLTSRAASPARPVLWAGLVAGLAIAARPAPAATTPRATPVRSVMAADSLLDTPPTPQRDKALAEWARRASANDLAWLLRRTTAELGTVEPLLLDAALAVTPITRTGLRQRWLVRRAIATPPVLRKGGWPLPEMTSLRPYASVFTLAVVLPDQGEYASYSRTLRAALIAGLAWRRADGVPPVTLDTLGTGESDPVRVADALSRARERSDVVVGELLSVPTQALATATAVDAFTLVSPTATDERIGHVGPRVFQAGPGVGARARALAKVVLGVEAHRAAIAGSASGVRSAFAQAFAAEVESRRGSVVRREVIRAGSAELKQLASSLVASGADVLFWDGPARDAESLVRALAAAGASLHVCGGPALAPEATRPALRPLFEGVTWVADDWRLPEAARSALDSLASANGMRNGSLMTRGFLVGRRIATAIAAGARTADEVAALLRNRDPEAAAGGFIDAELDGCTLPVFLVRGGKAVEAGQ